MGKLLMNAKKYAMKILIRAVNHLDTAPMRKEVLAICVIKSYLVLSQLILVEMIHAIQSLKRIA